MLDRFHSKFHRYNHHTNPTSGFPDSASDPIASPSDPFQGHFHVVGEVSATNIISLSNVFIGDAIIDISLLTAIRTFEFPNASGVILLDTTGANALSATLSPIISAAIVPVLITTITPIVSATIMPVLTSTVTPIVSAAVETSIVSLVSSLFDELNINRTVWVNPLSGNNSAGTRNRIDKAFKTLTAAQSAALSGDTIIVENGVYNEMNLGKDGVDWHFATNSYITITDFVSAPIFNFSGKNFNVFGNVSILLSGANMIPDAGNSMIASFSNAQAGDDIIFKVKDITVITANPISETPTSSLFSGVSSDANILIDCVSINAPKFNGFNGFFGASTPRILRINLDQNLIVQNLFNNSITNLGCYVYSPLVSATDYIFQDSPAITTIGGLWMDTDILCGTISKTTAVGNIYIDTNTFTITPRTSSITWATTSSGLMNLEIAGDFNLNTGMTVNGNTFITANDFTFKDSLSAGYGFKVRGSLVIDTQSTTLNYYSSAFNMFQIDLSGSELVVDMDSIVNNTPIANSNILATTSVISGALIDLDIDHLFGGGNISLSSVDIKARLYIGDTPSTTLNLYVSSTSIGTLISMGGGWKSPNTYNVLVKAVSGQRNTNLYLDSGTIFEATSGVNTFNLSQVAGNPFNIFARGTTLTNVSALAPGDNYSFHTGSFEIDSSIKVPVF